MTLAELSEVTKIDQLGIDGEVRARNFDLIQQSSSHLIVHHIYER